MALIISKRVIWRSAPPQKKTKTGSTAEAKALLRSANRKVLMLGREVARQLAHEHGTVHSQEVLRAMVMQGLYILVEGKPPYWLGALFRAPEWVWTGQYAQVEVPRTAKRTHAWRTVKIWRLA